MPGKRALWAFVRRYKGGWLLVTRNSLLVTRDFPTPRRAKHATPPAQVPPTQTLFARGPGAVGIIRYLVPIVTPWLDHGAQVIKSRATRGQIYDDHIFYIPHILNLNLLTQINLYTWILGSSPRMTILIAPG